MPLMILGLLLLIGLLAYSIVRYMNSGEEDQRSVRERYPWAFSSGKDHEHTESDNSAEDDNDEPIHAEGYVDSDSLRGDIDHIVRNIKETVNEKAKEHGIDLSKWGRDPLDHDPFGRNKKSRSDAEGSGTDKNDAEEDSTIIFPTDNVEAEKKKRNID